MRARSVVVGLAASLAACGTPPPAIPAPSALPSPTPVPGTLLSADGFVTVVPPGWSDHLSDTAAVSALQAAGNVLLLLETPPPSPASAGVTDVTGRIEVIRLAIPVTDDQLATHLASASDTGATNVSVAKPTDVDGAAGDVVTYDRDVGSTPAETEELLVNRNGSTYDIVLTTSQATYAEQRAGLTDVLTAWRWS